MLGKNEQEVWENLSIESFYSQLNGLSIVI